MPKAKASSIQPVPGGISTRCPTCGQPLREPVTQTGRILEAARERRGIDRGDLAEAVGVGRAVIDFLLSGRQGSKGVYLGMRSHKGQVPLAYRVADHLGVPRRKIVEAQIEDQLAMTEGHLNVCSIHLPSEQEERSSEYDASGEEQVKHAAPQTRSRSRAIA